MIRGKLIYGLVVMLLAVMVGCGGAPAEQPANDESDTSTSETNDESTSDTQDEASDDSASDDTDEAEGDSQASSPVGGSITLVYNDRALIIWNTSGTEVDISGLAFAGSTDDANESFSDSALGASLGVGECLALLTGRLTGQDLPDDWACDPVRETSLTTNVLFWRADAAEDETFTINNGDAEAGTCDTAGRAVNRLDDVTCMVEW